MINEEQITKKGNCKSCMYLGSTSCPDVLLMDNLDLDSRSCIQWRSNKNEEEEE